MDLLETMDKEKIREEMVRDSEEQLEQMFSSVKEHIWLDDEGDVYFDIDHSDVNNEDLIALLLIGRMYSAYIDLIDSPIVENQYISGQLGIDNDVISARVSDLKADGYVESPSQGKYKFNKHALKRFMDGIDI